MVSAEGFEEGWGKLGVRGLRLGGIGKKERWGGDGDGMRGFGIINGGLRRVYSP